MSDLHITLDIRSTSGKLRGDDAVVDASLVHPVPVEADKHDEVTAQAEAVPHPPAAAAPAAPVPPPDSWQGISREEHENSYIRQWGVYTAFDAGDRSPPMSWAGCHGVCAFIGADAQLNAIGTGTRATLAREIRTRLRHSPPFALFATTTNIAALIPFEVDGVASNRLIVWGDAIAATGVTHRLGNIRHVYAGSQSLVLLYDTPVEGLWLDVIGGPATHAVPAAVQLSLAADPPVSVHVTENAFAVLTSGGKVWAWGNATQGGTIPAATAVLLERMRVRKIVTSLAAFCAVTEDGQLVTWGDAAGGGTLPPATLEAILDDGGALSVVAGRAAFTCITRERRKAIAWGDAANGGTLSTAAAPLASAGNIVACKATANAFCIVAGDGRFAAWGAAKGGGTLPTAAVGIATAQTEPDAEQVEVTSSLRALFSADTAATKSDWVGANCATSDGQVALHATEAGFLMVVTATDGRITALNAWGSHTLPSDTVRQILLSSRLRQLVTCNRGCLALVDQGDDGRCVLVWGDATTTAILTSPIVDFLDSGVEEVRPINGVLNTATATAASCGFFCRNAAGTAAVWGTATPILVPLINALDGAPAAGP